MRFVYEVCAAYITKIGNNAQGDSIPHGEPSKDTFKPAESKSLCTASTRLTGYTEYEISKMEDSELGQFAYDYTALRDDVRKVEEHEKRRAEDEDDGFRPLRALECVIIDSLVTLLTRFGSPTDHSDMTGHGKTCSWKLEIQSRRVDLWHCRVAALSSWLLPIYET